jgi:hypothetical protein
VRHDQDDKANRPWPPRETKVFERANVPTQDLPISHLVELEVCASPIDRDLGAWLDPSGYDAGKKIKGRERHILVDTLGLL